MQGKISGWKIFYQNMNFFRLHFEQVCEKSPAEVESDASKCSNSCSSPSSMRAALVQNWLKTRFIRKTLIFSKAITLRNPALMHLRCYVTGTLNMLAKGVTCFFEVRRLSKPCGLYKLVLPQEQGLTNGYDASKLMVQGEVNKVMYGHSFLNITGMPMGRFLPGHLHVFVCPFNYISECRLFLPKYTKIYEHTCKTTSSAISTLLRNRLGDDCLFTVGPYVSVWGMSDLHI